MNTSLALDRQKNVAEGSSLAFSRFTALIIAGCYIFVLEIFCTSGRMIVTNDR
jgi:hypothetical protein